MLNELDNMYNEFVKDHVRAFGWMLANELLTIKIAIVCEENGVPLSETAIRKKGMFHQRARAIPG
jgi:hypothetical protein